ncbi:MAG: hypothetical protein RML47_00525 [Bacteroidota bacterium]|nr:hypothetical protein [Rhodothermia bacterium]MDW8284571.1 hypothetical protein [Bacteroidota bacterium]
MGPDGDRIKALTEVHQERLWDGLAAHQALLALGEPEWARLSYESFRAYLVRWFYVEANWLLPPYAERTRPRAGGQLAYFQNEVRVSTANLAVFDRKLELLPQEEPHRSRFLCAYFADLSAFRDYLEHHFLRLNHHVLPALEAHLHETERDFISTQMEADLAELALPALTWTPERPPAAPIPKTLRPSEVPWWRPPPTDSTELQRWIRREALESFFRFQVGLLYRDISYAQQELRALREALRWVFLANHTAWESGYDALRGFRNGRALLEGHERRIEEVLLALIEQTTALLFCPDGRSWWRAWVALWDRAQIAHYVLRFYLERSWATLVEQASPEQVRAWYRIFRSQHPIDRWLPHQG